MIKSPTAIALVSGGMDSLVSAAIACQQHPLVAFLHLSYGQKTAEKEQDCFYKIANHYKIPTELRKIFKIEFLQQIGGSSLTDKQIPVKKHRPDFLKTGIPDSYVPFRNTHIISMAVSWAEIIGAKFIYIGAVAEDSSGYPDCRPTYYKAMNTLIKEGTRDGNIRVVTPIISMSKKEIVEKAMALRAPLKDSWSCYAQSDLACGLCDSCVLRLKGMEQAGISDPIPYHR